MAVASPTRSAWLEFDRAQVEDAEKLSDLRLNLSAIEIHRNHACIVSDEHCFVERLRAERGGKVFAGHQRYSLARPFGLSSGDAEVDLEGLSRDGNRLWLLGSHCLTRKAAGKDLDTATTAFDALERMQVRTRLRTRDRCLLGCIDLAKLPGEGDKLPPGATAMVPFTKRDSSALLDTLADDEQLAPFLDLPAKDNGLDFEGLAVRGDAAFLGLRGPVLGGLAIVLELRLRVQPGSGTIALRKMDNGRRYAKHAFDLQGLGVRDLAFRGSHLLILAASTLPLDGIAVVFGARLAARWPGGGIVAPSEYRPLLRLPGGDRGDYAEGIACVGDEIAVVCDGPSKERLRGRMGIRLDYYRLPQARKPAAKR